jgi:two-component system, cell cycle sensor histidine kinase and response regulator CckA
MPSPAHGPTEGRRIIVTDDSSSKLATLTDILRDAGHCVFAAYEGVSALELFAQLPNIDLLVTNTRLGVVDGPELMRQVRAQRPDMPILHVIHGADPDRRTPPDVLSLREPFTRDDLLTAVGSLLA